MKNHQGIMHIPLIFGLMVSTITGASLLGLHIHWRHLVELQLRLDRCVAKTALQMRDLNSAIEAANLRMTALRVSIAATSLAPSARVGLEAALRAEAFIQQSRLNRWRAKQAWWALKRGCDGFSDDLTLLPSLPWVTEPPDLLGPRPLHWPETEEHLFIIKLSRASRRSAARVERDLDHWNAHWTRSSDFL